VPNRASCSGTRVRRYPQRRRITSGPNKDLYPYQVRLLASLPHGVGGFLRPLAKGHSVRWTAALVKAARLRVTVDPAAESVTVRPSLLGFLWAVLLDVDGSLVHYLPDSLSIIEVTDDGAVVVPPGRYGLRACDRCAGDIVGAARFTRLYCSDRCRQAAYRDRKRTASHRLDAPGSRPAAERRPSAT
jgi:hypothetical protein